MSKTRRPALSVGILGFHKSFSPFFLVFLKSLMIKEHLVFNLNAWMGWAVSYEDFQAFLPLAMSLCFFQITSDYLIPCFSWLSYGETTLNLGPGVLYLLDQALPFFLDD